MNDFQWVECPRDAMQGFSRHIPVHEKIEYLNLLLKCGFHTLDFGSFVSPKAIPQLADTQVVLENLQLEETNTRLLAIVANERGAQEAATLEKIQYLGFPFSLSETFQRRNTNASQMEAFELIKKIQHLCIDSGKELVIYFSMGFGNPYGDLWNFDLLNVWLERMQKEGIRIVSFADTVGIATPEVIEKAFKELTPIYPDITLGAHLHTRYDDWKEKVNAAFNGGCRRFDTAMKGFGGCPMADDQLVGNLPSEHLSAWLTEKNISLNLNIKAFQSAMQLADRVFSAH